MIDHLQTEDDVRRAEQRRHWRIVRAWEGRPVRPVPGASSVDATDTQPTPGVSAASILCVSGYPFLLGGIAAVVERRYAAEAGFHSDALIIRLSGAAQGTFRRLAIRVADLDAMFRFRRARLAQGGAPLDPAVDEPEVPRPRKARTTAMPPSEELEAPRPDASAFPIRMMQETGRAIPQPRTGPRSRASASSREPSAPRGSRTRRWAPSGLAMAHAIIFTQLGADITNIRRIYECIMREWRPEWGRAPCYDTVRGWVHAAIDASRDDRHRALPTRKLRRASRGGDCT